MNHDQFTNFIYFYVIFNDDFDKKKYSGKIQLPSSTFSTSARKFLSSAQTTTILLVLKIVQK